MIGDCSKMFSRLFLVILLIKLCECRSRDLVGKPCFKEGVAGICKKLAECTYYEKLIIEQEVKVPICQYKGRVKIVCCPTHNLLYRTGVFRNFFMSTEDGVLRSSNMTCRYEGIQPILCCQNKPEVEDPPEPRQCPPLPKPTLEKNMGHFLWDKCVSYQRYFNKCIEAEENGYMKMKRLNTCGIPNESTEYVRIANGNPAHPREFPHMAVLGCHNTVSEGDADIIWVGGGSLISEKFILTASHVLVENKFGRLRYALLGTLNKFDIRSGLLVNVIKTIAHKLYTKGEKPHDIALLELLQRVKYNEFIRPACLPVPGMEIGDERMITGWGEIDERGTATEVLLTATVKENRSLCEMAFGSRSYFPETMICASGPAGQPTDTCRGDSGGPLMALIKNIPCSYSIEGIVSYGPQCGKGTGVYTRVTNYLNWIIEIVWPDEFKLN